MTRACSGYLTIVFCGSLLISSACRRVSDTGTLTNRVVAGPAEVGDRSRRLNINTASEEELSKLPFVGPKLASEIVEYRRRYGPFRKPEHLMLIQGISEKRYRSIQNLISTE